jgi:TfoX/Sxy family transcriptional regulator of competence genes
MAYDEGLAERVRERLAERRDIREKRMFGGLSFLRDGQLFVGVRKNDLMVRVGPAQFAAACRRPHVQPMVFARLPKLVGYVLVAPEGVDFDDDLQSWIDLATQFAATLPAKAAAKKPATTKKAAAKKAATKKPAAKIAATKKPAAKKPAATKKPAAKKAATKKPAPAKRPRR